MSQATIEECLEAFIAAYLPRTIDKAVGDSFNKGLSHVALLDQPQDRILQLERQWPAQLARKLGPCTYRKISADSARAI
jgi:hypothetical protein